MIADKKLVPKSALGDLSSGERFRHAAPKISIYPLHQLDAEVTSPMRIGDGINIIPNAIDLNKIRSINISKEDARHLINTQLCLQIDEGILCPEKASIAFIVSCRLLKRTRVFIRYRVDSSNEIKKIRDDYPFVTARNVTTIIKQQEFKKVANLYSGLNKFKTLSTRAGNAVYFLV